MAVIRNPYDPGIPVPLPTYGGSLGDWRAMMEFEPWKQLIEQKVTFNPQWLPNIPPWMVKKDDPVVVDPVVVDPWIDPDNGVTVNGDNGGTGNGGTGNGGAGNGGAGEIIWTDPDTGESIVYGVDTGGTGTEEVEGISTGAVEEGIEEGYPGVGAVDQALIDAAEAQALADAQELAAQQAAAEQALFDQQAADALAAQQAADAQAAANVLLEQQRLEGERIRQAEEAAAEDALLEQQRLEDERIRQEQEAAAVENERIRQVEEAAAEERQALEDAAYSRVSTAKDKWGKQHWELHGKAAGRDLPGNFGDYVDSYPDLKDAYLEHRRSLKSVEDETTKETTSPVYAPLWMKKPDGTWGWINPMTFQEEKFLWTDPEETGGIAPTGLSGTQLAGASGYPRWVPDNPYARITPSSKGRYYYEDPATAGRVQIITPWTYQQFLDVSRTF